MTNSRVEWLGVSDAPPQFPDVETALREPDGLLAAGGDLSSERLLCAYANGIFPWYEEGQPILWWSPNPRCVLRPENFRVSRRLRRYTRSSTLSLSVNHSFAEVVHACAGRRNSQNGTWITPQMLAAYQNLHAAGWAHSIEVWDDTDLVGGIYGLAIGRVFFGESMFSHRDNASKFAMLALCQILSLNDFALLDCQVLSSHLQSLGATLMPRPEFTKTLSKFCVPAKQFDNWPAKHRPIAELLGN